MLSRASDVRVQGQSNGLQSARAAAPRNQQLTAGRVNRSWTLRSGKRTTSRASKGPTSRCTTRAGSRGEWPAAAALGAGKGGLFAQRGRSADALSCRPTSSWDEWVPEDRLKKYNEENVRKQKALIEAQRARDAAEREAAKASDAAESAAMKKLAGQGASAQSNASGARKVDNRGQKRARDEAVSVARSITRWPRAS